MDKYPAVSFLVKNGTLLSVIVGLVPIVLALWAVSGGWGIVWLVLGVGAGILGGLLMKIIAELTTIIADMLLPQ